MMGPGDVSGVRGGLGVRSSFLVFLILGRSMARSLRIQSAPPHHVPGRHRGRRGEPCGKCLAPGVILSQAPRITTQELVRKFYNQSPRL